MNAPKLRIGIAIAAIASTAGCASPRAGDVQAFVLAHTEPAQLAEALSQKLASLPANDPRRDDPKIVALRRLLGDGPVTAVQAAGQEFELLAPAQFTSASLSAPSDAPAAIKVAFAAEAAPSPVQAAPTVFAVALGTFDDAALAASIWRELAAADPLAVKGLSARLATTKGQAGVTLVAGPLEDKDTAAGRCTAFAALGVQCAPGVYAGKPLPGSGV